MFKRSFWRTSNQLLCGNRQETASQAAQKCSGSRTATKRDLSTNVVIVGAKRTPVGTFHGGLASLTGPALGVVAAKAAMKHAGVQPEDVEEVYMGSVLQGGVGQAPARQVALGSGMKLDTPSTTVNKVCASGMKSVMMAAQAIRLGDRNIMLAGGMESMSNAPHYLRIRKATGYGDSQAIDAIQFDGLTDAYDNVLMGKCTERVVKEFGLTREEQDVFAVRSYENARFAQENGFFDSEIEPVEVKERKKTTTVSQDEECKRYMPDKFPTLKPAFEKDGTITPANASKINDGAAAILLMSEDEAKARNLKPLARIISYEDAAVEPFRFAVANTLASEKALQKAGLSASDIHFHEINEAFAAVPMINAKNLGIDLDTVNMHGGGVALGHPIGASGARILISLISVLQRNDSSLGMASICNGGGGSSALILERLN